MRGTGNGRTSLIIWHGRARGSKPVKLIERIVRSASAAGDLVLDPFLGSGTTAVVAEQSGRRWLGIEKSRAYVRMAQQRIKAERARRKSAEKKSETD